MIKNDCLDKKIKVLDATFTNGEFLNSVYKKAVGIKWDFICLDNPIYLDLIKESKDLIKFNKVFNNDGNKKSYCSNEFDEIYTVFGYLYSNEKKQILASFKNALKSKGEITIVRSENFIFNLTTSQECFEIFVLYLSICSCSTENSKADKNIDNLEMFTDICLGDLIMQLEKLNFIDIKINYRFKNREDKNINFNIRAIDRLFIYKAFFEKTNCNKHTAFIDNFIKSLRKQEVLLLDVGLTLNAVKV